MQNLLGVVPAPMNDVGSTAELPPHEGRTGEPQGGGPCQGPCLPLADVLPLPHPCITIMWIMPASFIHPWKFIPAHSHFFHANWTWMHCSASQKEKLHKSIVLECTFTMNLTMKTLSNKNFYVALFNITHPKAPEACLRWSSLQEKSEMISKQACWQHNVNIERAWKSSAFTVSCLKIFWFFLKL